MSEFIPCAVCDPKISEQCAILRHLTTTTKPELSGPDMAEDESIDEYAHRLSAHKIAVRIVERVTWGCTEFAPDVQQLSSNTDIREYLDEL